MGAPRRSASRITQRRVSLIRNSERQKQKEEHEKREATKRRRKPIDIHVRILTGRLITIQVSPDDTVEEVSEKINMREGINPDQQILLFSGHRLHEDATIDDYLIQEYATLFLTLRNRGG